MLLLIASMAFFAQAAPQPPSSGIERARIAGHWVHTEQKPDGTTVSSPRLTLRLLNAPRYVIVEVGNTYAFCCGCSGREVLLDREHQQLQIGGEWEQIRVLSEFPAPEKAPAPKKYLIPPGDVPSPRELRSATVES
jgi:hypothetical protein